MLICLHLQCGHQTHMLCLTFFSLESWNLSQTKLEVNVTKGKQISQPQASQAGYLTVCCYLPASYFFCILPAFLCSDWCNENICLKYRNWMGIRQCMKFQWKLISHLNYWSCTVPLDNDHTSWNRHHLTILWNYLAFNSHFLCTFCQCSTLSAGSHLFYSSELIPFFIMSQIMIILVISVE